MFRSLRSVRAPNPSGGETQDHTGLDRPLRRLQVEGPSTLPSLEPDLRAYVDTLSLADPDLLSRHEALAFWLNLYNAGALLLAGEAVSQGEASVLLRAGGFRRPFVTIAGEALSLDAIEHAKLRRFQDARIHGALVCGSLSCPTLRAAPYRGDDIGNQLDDQMRSLLAGGALVIDRPAGLVLLSRIFLWFGSDFVRPHRMPSLLPTTRRTLLGSLRPWIAADTVDWIESTRHRVGFQQYDWGLACTVA